MNSYQNYSMDEIIFENRNKAYGAFQLRQTIDRNASIGLLVTVSAFAVLMLLYQLSAFNKHETIISSPIINIKTMEFKDQTITIPKPKPVENQTPPPTVNATMFKEFKVVQTVPVTQPIPSQSELTNTVIGEQTIINAVASVNPIPSEVTAPNSTGNMPVVESTPAIVTTTIFKTAEILPSYPEGNAALMKYLRDNIHPYSSDVETGNIGKVVLRFYIDTDGSVRNPEIIKDGIGGRCGEVAISAIKKMPKWKPGMQNGTPVKVYFTLPVTFDFSHN